MLFFSKENKIFSLVEQSLKKGEYNNIDIDKNFLENINKFATVKHIIKNDDNHAKLFEIFEDIKKDLKTYSLELLIQEQNQIAQDFNQTTFDEIRLKKEQNIN